MAAFGFPSCSGCTAPACCSVVRPSRSVPRRTSLFRSNAELSPFKDSPRVGDFKACLFGTQRSDRPARANYKPSLRCRAATTSTQLVKSKRRIQATTASALVGAFLILLGHASEVHAATQGTQGIEQFQLASEDSEFWVNVSRYGRYFITVLLGTAYISVKPVIELLKRPKTAFLVVAGVAVLYLFVSTTVQAMLGVSNPLDYQPSSFFPENY